MSENESDNEEAQDTTVNAGIDRTEEWAALRAKYLLPAEERPASNARGVHHMVLMCSDVEETIKFYQGVLGFPLTEIFENRDYPGSTHFFFDIGNGNLLGFFDFPGLGLGEYAEVLGGFHHVALSVNPERHAELKAGFASQGIEIDFDFDTSVYISGPDGERIELIADDLGTMYGQDVS